MKKTLISLATASLIASTAMAADKGIDLDVSGQAVVYYQTTDTVDFFSQDSSKANVGLQLNIDGALGNGFTMGSQISYLGTAGLEKNLVSNVMQSTNGVAGAVTQGGIDDNFAVTKFFVAKQIANTTLKIGRQELPKSLSPLAFSEGWNVFKNTFDAILAVNTDIPDTTVVAAWVGSSNNHNSMGTFDGLQVTTPATLVGTVVQNDGAYMLTVANKSIPMVALTASYYHMSKVAGGTDAMWLDAKIADKSLPMGLNVGIQAGTISPDALDETTAFGIKVGAKPIDALKVCAAFTSVDDGAVAIKNVGTGTKTPLYTQMVVNQDSISLDADTIMLSGAYSLGDAGTVILRGSQTTAGAGNLKGENDFTDLELLYKVKAGGVNFLAALVNKELDDGSDAVNIVRVVARYNF